MNDIPSGMDALSVNDESTRNNSAATTNHPSKDLAVRIAALPPELIMSLAASNVRYKGNYNKGPVPSPPGYGRLQCHNRLSDLDVWWNLQVIAIRDSLRFKLKEAATLSLGLDARQAVIKRQMPPIWLAGELRDVAINVFPTVNQPFDTQNEALRHMIGDVRMACPKLISLAVTWRVPDPTEAANFPWTSLELQRAVHVSLYPVPGQLVPNRDALRGFRFTTDADGDAENFLETLFFDGTDNLYNGNVTLYELEMMHSVDSMLIIPTGAWSHMGPQAWSAQSFQTAADDEQRMGRFSEEFQQHVEV